MATTHVTLWRSNRGKPTSHVRPVVRVTPCYIVVDVGGGETERFGRVDGCMTRGRMSMWIDPECLPIQD